MSIIRVLDVKALTIIPTNTIRLKFFSSMSLNSQITPATTLLGPPELRNLTPLPAPQQPAMDGGESGDPFMNLMVASYNKAASVSAPSWPPMGLTENRSPTFLSSGNPCLDFFFHVVPNTPSEYVTQRIQAAWDHNPLTTLKFICNLRGVRGTGKSDKEGFYTAACWLHSHHPKTLAGNVTSFADFGYSKDLLEIIYRILEGHDVRKNQKEELRRQREESSNKSYEKYSRFRYSYYNTMRSKENKKESSVSREKRISDAIERNKIVEERARELRKAKSLAMAKKVIDRYYGDEDFRLLYDCVSDYFAECLKKDIDFHNAGKFTKVSLAAKWCPSLDSSYDKFTLICESIARKVFPKESYPEYEGLEEAHYAYRVRDRLRKQVLTPLRKCLQLPEVFMSANKWDLLPYKRVASIAMQLYKEKFLEHDQERFISYLGDVKSGKARMAAGALLPHEIIKSLYDDDGTGQVAELQWKRMVDDLLEKGKLRNCLAISDVSGSMDGEPLKVSVALGLLVSELSEEPWKGKLITFSENPELQLAEGDDLKSKIEFVKRMEWDMNTDFQKVFDLILQVAMEGKLKPEQMIKRLFVFSDMEFDQASLNPWETDYQVIVRKYTEKGYGLVVPQIVFWNLRDSRATPVSSTQNGVALVSGFSKNLLKLFLDNDGDITTESVMEAAIAGEEYQKLTVLD